MYLEKIRNIENEVKDLKLQLSKANSVVEATKSILSEGQMRKLMSPGRIQWKWKDISNALCLHASGPRAYRHLYKKGYPLPHKTTLQRWCRKVFIEEGILWTSIEFMGQITDLSEDEKLCILSFDEMKVMEAYEYDCIKDVVKGPAKFVQVVMARGIKSSFKQPVFFI